MIAFSEGYHRRRPVAIAKCQICLEYLLTEVVNLGCHTFHSHCLDSYFREQLRQQRFPIVCPKEGCERVLPTNFIKHLQPDIQMLYTEHQLREYIRQHANNVILCPGHNCPYWFEYTNVCLYKPVGRLGSRLACFGCFKKYCRCRQSFDCPSCGTNVCLKCREAHKGLSCYQHKWNKGVDYDSLRFVECIKKARFKNCPKCKYWVEKADGCDHMVCLCKYEFCYHCNGKYQECQCDGNPETSVDLSHLYPKLKKPFKPFTAVQPKKQQRAKTLPSKRQSEGMVPVLPFWARWMQQKKQKLR